MAFGRTSTLRRTGASLSFAGVLALAAGLVFAPSAPAAAGAAARLDQCANGNASAPPVDCTGSAWVNGNLNPAKSQYGEGDTVPYRAVITDLPNDGQVHSIEIEWDVTKQGKYATDHLNPLSAVPGVVDPCSGVVDCGAEGTPVAPFSIFGAEISSITSVTDVGSPENLSARQTISFDPAGSTVVLAWGGHIARSQDHPEGAASAIPGSPYHMRLNSLDGGTVGMQDRSLKVAPASALSVDKSATPEVLAQTGPVVFTIVITNNDAQKVTIDSIVDDVFGDVTTECQLPTKKPDRTLDAGETFTCEITRTITPAAAPHVDVVTVTDNKGLTASDDAIVAFTSAPPVLSLVKTPGATTVRTGTDVTYTYAVSVTGGAVSDVALVDDKCLPVLTSTDGNGVLEPGETWSYSCTHAIDAASVTNIATASGEDAQGNPISDTAQATVAGITPRLSMTKASDVESVTEGGTVTYTYTVTNTGDDLLDDVAVADDKCQPVTRTSGDADGLAPGETWTFTCVQVITGAASQLTNIGTATAVDSLGLPVTASATKTITVLAPTVSHTAGEVVTEVKDVVFERATAPADVVAAPAAAVVPDLARTGQTLDGLVLLGLSLLALGGSIMVTNSLVTAHVRRSGTD